MEDIERHFFRYISCVQVAPFEIANKVYFESCDGAPDYDITAAIDKINAEIKRYELEVVRGRSEVSGIEYVTFNNVAKSSISERAKFHDKKTKLLFSKIIESIALAGGCITDRECGNLSTLAEMSKTAAGGAISDLAENKWLEIENGNVYLGVRSITELGQLLKETFPEQVKSCHLCRNIVCHGETCPSCGEKGHSYCLSKFWERQQTCPHCKTNWPGASGSRNVASDKSDEESTPGPTQRKRSRLISSDDEDD